MRLTKPQKEVANIEAPSGLPVPKGKNPAHKFVYVVYPRGWDYHPDYGFLPQLKKIIAKPGANGVNKHGDMSKVLASVAQKGGTYISPTDNRLPEEYRNYVQYYDTTCGRRWYVDFCSQVAVLPNGELLWSATPGEWDKFRAAIRDSGIIPDMLPEIYQGLKVSKEKILARIAITMHGNPVRTAEYEKSKAALEHMEKFWGSLNTPEKAKPITRKRKAAKDLL